MMIPLLMALVIGQPDVEAALALAQAQQANQLAVVQTLPEPANRSYADAFHAAHKAGRPLVIWIDCPCPKLPPTRSYETCEVGAGEWWDMTKTVERGVLISVGGWRHKLLPPEATAEQIGLEVHRATAPVQPAVRSRTQIDWGQRFASPFRRSADDK